MDHGEGQRLTRRRSRSRFDEARFLRPGPQAGSEMEEEDEKDKETYVVGALGNVHAT